MELSEHWCALPLAYIEDKNELKPVNPLRIRDEANEDYPSIWIYIYFMSTEIKTTKIAAKQKRIHKINVKLHTAAFNFFIRYTFKDLWSVYAVAVLNLTVLLTKIFWCENRGREVSFAMCTWFRKLFAVQTSNIHTNLHSHSHTHTHTTIKEQREKKRVQWLFFDTGSVFHHDFDAHLFYSHVVCLLKFFFGSALLYFAFPIFRILSLPQNQLLISTHVFIGMQCGTIWLSLTTNSIISEMFAFSIAFDCTFSANFCFFHVSAFYLFSTIQCYINCASIAVH